MLSSGSLKSFPFKLPGFTVLAPASFEVKRKANGTIWVKLNWEACLFSQYPEQMKTLPKAICHKGIDLPEDEPIEIVLYDQGEKREQTLPLFFLLLEHQTNAQLVSKFIEAGLLLTGGGAIRTAGKGVWVLIDQIVLGLAVTTSVMEEHRGWILSTFGEKGAKFLKATHYLNFALGLYGGVRVVKEMPKLVATFGASWKQLKASLKSSTSLSLDEEEQALRLGLEQEGDQLLSQVEALEQAIKPETPVLSSSTFSPNAPTNVPNVSKLSEPKPSPWLTPESSLSSKSPLSEIPLVPPEEGFVFTPKPLVPERVVPSLPRKAFPSIRVECAKELEVLTQRLTQAGQKAALAEVQEAVAAAERGQLLGLETWLKEGIKLDQSALLRKVLQLRKAKKLWNSKRLPVQLGKQGQVEVVMMAESQAGAGSKTGTLSATGTDGAGPSSTSPPAKGSTSSPNSLSGATTGTPVLPKPQPILLVHPSKPIPTSAQVRSWIKGFERKKTPDSTARNQYEIRYTGPENIIVKGGGEKIAADGIAESTGYLQEAKFIENPKKSPYIECSNCYKLARESAIQDVKEEFRRYKAIIEDPNTPVIGLELITNLEEARPFFEKLFREYQIPGRVVIRP